MNGYQPQQLVQVNRDRKSGRMVHAFRTFTVPEALVAVAAVMLSTFWGMAAWHVFAAAMERAGQ